MKAFVLEKYGQPLRAVNMPIPEPGPRQVLVRMAASGVNHADERTRVGEFKAVFRLDLPKVMGGELSGEVIALGSQVTEVCRRRQGLRLYRRCRYGNMGRDRRG